MDLLDEYGKITGYHNVSCPEKWEETSHFTTVATSIGPRTIRSQRPICIDNVLHNVYKEINFKYCECMISGKKNEFWTGSSESECKGRHARFEQLELTPEYAIFKCPVSGYNIVILKSTEKEIGMCGYFQTLVEEWPKKECTHMYSPTLYALKIEDGNCLCSICGEQWIPQTK